MTNEGLYRLSGGCLMVSEALRVSGTRARGFWVVLSDP